MNQSFFKDSLVLMVVGGLVLISLLFMKASSAAKGLIEEHSQEIERIQQDIQVVKTLSRSGPEEIREVDLLQKLNGYCQQLDIARLDCQIQTQTPIQNEEFSALRYSVTLQNLLMGDTVEYFRKLESLPQNVRVSLASVRRVAPREPSEGQPNLLVRLEMNEIKFRR